MIKPAVTVEKRTTLILIATIAAVVIGLILVALLAQAHVDGVNRYGDDPITASVRAGYTNQAQATLHPAPATPLPVRIVP